MAMAMEPGTTTTTTSMTMVSEEYTETRSGGGGSTSLKRQSSWRKFKDTVKGWVGAGPGQQPEDPNVPSAVFPSAEVNRATTCVNTVLHNTNCYSGAGGRPVTTSTSSGETSPLSSMPSSPTDALPRIVVTFDEKPHRPPRRAESLRIRPSVSTPDIADEEDDFSRAAGPRFPTHHHQQHQPVPIPIVVQRSSAGAEAATTDNIPTLPVGSLPETSGDDEDAAEMQKRMAVMKIRQAMKNMKAAQDISMLLPRPGADLRRHSDINASEVALVTARQHQQAAASAGGTPTGSGSPAEPSEAALRQQQQQQQQQHLLRRKSTSNASMKKHKAKPMIWDHFDMLPHTSQQGRCKTCKMNVSCKFNTGNFVRHLQLAHKDVYRQYQNKMESAWTRSNLERSLK